MAQWNDLVAYIRQTYRVIRDDPGEIRIRVLFGDDAECRAGLGDFAVAGPGQQ